MIDEKIALIVPVLIGMLSIMKNSGFPAKYIPACALIFGLICGFLIVPSDYINAIATGAGIGFSSIGVHSGIKNTIKK